MIDDTYNANPDSVRAAIDVLAAQTGDTLLVLGDMGEVGKQGVAFHAEDGAYAKARGINQLYTLGELAKEAGQQFGSGARHFAAITALRLALNEIGSATTVLVKGSRFMRMERAVQQLTGAAS